MLTSFIADSIPSRGGADGFRTWFDGRCREVAQTGDLRPWLARQRDRTKSAAHEIALCRDVHRMVKKAIPKFSLDRGFEFRYTMQYGERQCFLQSVLIAALLQDAGVDAGVAMVWSNEKGQESNLGHAVTLVRLRNGTHVVVDASEQRPFATHRGLYALVNGKYAFLKPSYDSTSSNITGWSRGSGGKVPMEAVSGLPVDFLRSQFEFYRGERAPRGLVAKAPTKAGLAASAAHLRKAVALCPENPLAVFSLGKTRQLMGDEAGAETWMRKARPLYEAQGWTPGALEP